MQSKVMYSKVKVMYFVHSSNVNHDGGDITKYTDKI